MICSAREADEGIGPIGLEATCDFRGGCFRDSRPPGGKSALPWALLLCSVAAERSRSRSRACVRLEARAVQANQQSARRHDAHGPWYVSPMPPLPSLPLSLCPRRLPFALPPRRNPTDSRASSSHLARAPSTMARAASLSLDCWLTDADDRQGQLMTLRRPRGDAPPPPSHPLPSFHLPPDHVHAQQRLPTKRLALLRRTA